MLTLGITLKGQITLSGIFHISTAAILSGGFHFHLTQGNILKYLCPLLRLWALKFPPSIQDIFIGVYLAFGGLFFMMGIPVRFGNHCMISFNEKTCWYHGEKYFKQKWNEDGLGRLGWRSSEGRLGGPIGRACWLRQGPIAGMPPLRRKLNERQCSVTEEILSWFF